MRDVGRSGDCKRYFNEISGFLLTGGTNLSKKTSKQLTISVICKIIFSNVVTC